ncbi:glycerophosphoryl diester phosphodiesterase [Thermococcus onnurineus NA1]|uniref:Glycerophosphoryl diester phosphodiesterase n=1 Tax=Thermococcus onnurineus (strain NA1) TaxID=523850 RepID=B6YSZ8_THEON|nr:glycerophosphodiester phosphodiesterase family protein [Thermococcus onnurineus]ACJ15685.1 glycerophosphoryl diester phosphodiesterase [Thermococcus onnurineus NA1]
MVPPMILGHRGFKGRLENTLPAFRRALRYADGIEFDVRVAGDGKLVVHHDEGFQANGSYQYIRELSLRELRRVHPNGRLIPTVRNVFREFSGALLNADLKEIDAVEGTLGLAERFGILENVVFSTENREIAEHLIKECPSCKVGFSIVSYSSIAHLAGLKGLYSVHVPIDTIGYVGYKALVVLLRTLRKRGTRIYLWNYQMDELYWVPRLLPFVDAVISDDPARLRKSFYPKGLFAGGDGNAMGT